MTGTSRRLGGFPIVLAAGLAAAGPVCAAGKTGTSGSSESPAAYASLARWPRLAGMWVPLVPFFMPPDPSQPPPAAPPREIKPEVGARYAEAVRQFLAAGPTDRGYCLPAKFGGRMPYGAGGSFELLYTPGRVTMAVENGLVRRVYLSDAPSAQALEESRGGTSIAHWEGQTLVIETTGIAHDAWLVAGLAVGNGARATERISLDDPDNLRVESIVTAPDILTAPVKTVTLYRRVPGRQFTEFDTCVGDDRSFDQANKAERFDATPPPDLPPPPAE